MRLFAAMLWELWRVQRFTVIAMTLALGAMAVIVQLVPPANRIDWLPTLAQLLMAVSVLAVFVGFTFTETNRQLKHAVYPVRLFTLPVPTSMLVLIPMLSGATAVALVYVAWLALVFQPLDYDQPLIGPMLVLTTGIMAYQAVIWGLAEHRLSRLIICGAIGGLLLWVLILPESLLPGFVTSGSATERSLKLGGLLLVVNVSIVAITWRNLARQRHRPTTGTATASSSPVLTQPGVADRRDPFRSAARAQLWLEWRRNGWILPGLAMFIAVLIAFPVPWLTGLDNASALRFVAGSAIALVVLAILVGKGFAVPDFWTRDMSLPPFVAIRPLGSGEWVFIRLQLAALCAAGACLAVFVAVAVALTLNGSWAGLWSALAPADAATMPRWLVVTGYAAFVFLLVWRGLVISLYNGLTGRAGWFLAATIGTFVVQLLLVPWLLIRHSHELTPYNTTFNWRPLIWIIVGAWLIKLLAAWWAWSECRRARLISARTLAGYVGGWLIAVFALASFVLTALPVDLWLRQVAALAIGLVVPLARIGLAPVAFAHNRHRHISDAPPSAEAGWARGRRLPLPSFRSAPVFGILLLALGVTAMLAARQIEQVIPQLIEANSQQYRVLVSGRGSPTVVLEGDMQATLKTWAPIQQALARETTVLAYERAGYGASPAASRPPTLAQNTTALAELLRQRKLEGPLVLVGAHIGAAYTKTFAGTFPDQVRGMVLLDPSDGETSTEIREHLHRDYPELKDRMTAFIDEINPLYRPYAIRQLLAIEQELATVGRSAVESTRVERWQALKAERVYMKTYQYTRADPGAQAEFRQLDALLAEQRTARWPAVPLVVLTGTKLGRPSLLERESLQSGPLAAKLAQRMEWLASLPTAEHVVMPDAGEDLIGDAPDEVVRQVRVLLERLRTQ